MKPFKRIPNNEKTRAALLAKEYRLGLDCDHSIKVRAHSVVMSMLQYKKYTKAKLIEELKEISWTADKIRVTLYAMNDNSMIKYDSDMNIIFNKNKFHKVNGIWFHTKE